MATLSVIDFASIDPGRVAVRVGERRISFRDFELDILSVGSWLKRQGVRSGDCVGVCLDAPYACWVFHFASLFVGAKVQTLRSALDASFFRLFGIDYVFTDEPRHVSEDILRATLVKVNDKSSLGEQLKVSAPLDRDSNSFALAKRVVMTSGTTGSLKSVVLSPEDIIGRADAYSRFRSVGADTKLFCLLNLGSTGGFFSPLGAWRRGGCVFLSEGSEDVKDLAFDCDHLTVVPKMLQDLLARFAGVWPGKDSRAIAIGGGRLPVSVREAAFSRCASSVTIAYGSTESGSVAAGDSRLLDRHPGAVGFVQSQEGVVVEVVDDFGVPVAFGQAGAVRIRTPYMAKAYDRFRKDDSPLPLRDGWFYPGDEGVLFEDGLFAINGRVSDTLNVGGAKISIASIEAELENLPSVKDYCAVSLNFDDMDKLAIVVVMESGKVTKEVEKIVSDKLRNRKVPFNIVQVSSIPRNAMGKVSRTEVALDVRKKIEAVNKRSAARRPA